MIGPAIVALLGQPAVVAVLGDRVYPVNLPTDPVLPAVAYQVVGETRPRRARGRSGLVRSQVQLSVVGSDYDEAHAVADVIRQAIDRVQGEFVGITIRDVLEDGTHDDPGDNAPQLVAMTWVMHWRESP